MFLDGQGNAVNERSRSGPLACGVPGSVAGLALAERKYGKLTLAKVMAPAIALARDGFVVSRSLADSFRRAQPRLSKFPASLKAFYKDDGSPLHEGDRLVQQDLARTLQPHRQRRAPTPSTAARSPISWRVKWHASGGLITKADLAAYRPAERAPVTGTYHGYRVVSMPPPSSGGVGLLELLNILEPYPVSEYGANSARTMHLMIEAERRVYADRARVARRSGFLQGARDWPDFEDLCGPRSGRRSTSRMRRRAPTSARELRATSSQPRRRTIRSSTPRAARCPRRRR